MHEYLTSENGWFEKNKNIKKENMYEHEKNEIQEMVKKESGINHAQREV